MILRRPAWLCSTASSRSHTCAICSSVISVAPSSQDGEVVVNAGPLRDVDGLDLVPVRAQLAIEAVIAGAAAFAFAHVDDMLALVGIERSFGERARVVRPAQQQRPISVLLEHGWHPRCD